MIRSIRQKEKEEERNNYPCSNFSPLILFPIRYLPSRCLGSDAINILPESDHNTTGRNFPHEGTRGQKNSDVSYWFRAGIAPFWMSLSHMSQATRPGKDEPDKADQ